jgi:hypothetical protein
MKKRQVIAAARIKRADAQVEAIQQQVTPDFVEQDTLKVTGSHMQRALKYADQAIDLLSHSIRANPQDQQLPKELAEAQIDKAEIQFGMQVRALQARGSNLDVDQLGKQVAALELETGKRQTTSAVKLVLFNNAFKARMQVIDCHDKSDASKVNSFEEAIAAVGSFLRATAASEEMLSRVGRLKRDAQFRMLYSLLHRFCQPSLKKHIQ